MMMTSADLVERIDARDAGRELLKRMAGLSDLRGTAVELVDLVGLAPHDAARALGVSPPRYACGYSAAVHDYER